MSTCQPIGNSIEGLGKRYQRHWVFRDLTHDFVAGSCTAILGRNGSGKSTLLRIIAGMQPPSAGKVAWLTGDAESIAQQDIFRLVSFCAPGMELPEELTLEEALRFHFSYKKPLAGFDVSGIIEATGLRAAARKPIGDYSSGMKQRVKLAQALFSDTPLLLLDEPCTNLDEAGVEQYMHWMAAYTPGRTVIVASNDAREYGFCEDELRMADYM